MYIIRGIYGSCVEIIDAIIDPTDIELIHYGLFIQILGTRSLLIHPLERENIGKIVKTFSENYKSCCTYLDKFHFHKRIPNSKYFSVDWSSPKAVAWLKNRFEYLNYDFDNFEQSYERMKAFRDYDDCTIPLEEILSGNLIKILQPHVDVKLNENLYQAWLELTLFNFPFEN